jgi:hypothetical protein
MHVVGYCRTKEELGASENALNRYMKGFYKKQWANKNLGNGKNNIEGLIPIIKKGKKIRYVRPEELEHYKSLGWSKGAMFYKMRKEGEALQEVGEEQVRSLLEAGYFFEGHNSITLHHPEVKDSSITVIKETGYMEEDILEAVTLGFVLGRASKGHNPTPNVDIDSVVKPFLLTREKRRHDRREQTKRSVFEYTIKLGGKTEKVKREQLVPFLKEGWVVTYPKKISLYHPSVKGSQIEVSKTYKGGDILEAVNLGFEIGHPPKEHNPTPNADIDSVVKPFLLTRKKVGGRRVAVIRRVSVKYTLKLGNKTETVNKEELIPLLQKKEGWKITSHESIHLYHPSVKDSTIKVNKKTGYMEEDILEAFGEGFALGSAPQGHETTADKETGAKVQAYLVSFRKRRDKRRVDTNRDSTRYTLKKGDEPPLGFTRYEVLGKLKEGYRSTKGSISICNKEGKYTSHYFEDKRCKYNIEERHLKLISLLESGEWVIGAKWE